MIGWKTLCLDAYIFFMIKPMMYSTNISFEIPNFQKIPESSKNPPFTQTNLRIKNKVQAQQFPTGFLNNLFLFCSKGQLLTSVHVLKLKFTACLLSKLIYSHTTISLDVYIWTWLKGSHTTYSSISYNCWILLHNLGNL